MQNSSFTTTKQLRLFKNILFHPFDYTGYKLPEHISSPIYYTPSKIAKKASKHLQNVLEQNYSLHDFKNELKKGDGGGKMFGVLVVQKKNNEVGYLAAFSGKLGGKTIVPGFVPPIFDLLDTKNYFLKEEEKISAITLDYSNLIGSEKYKLLKSQLEIDHAKKINKIEHLKSQISINKTKRKEIRKTISDPIKISDLNHQSALEKIEMKNLKRLWSDKIKSSENKLKEFEKKIQELEGLRKFLSSELQKRIFESYVLKNANGDKLNMLDVFLREKNQLPPAASGECAAPKLFNYAYLNDFKPIALAEFWWGEGSRDKIRKHKHYYPVCKSKCEPILNFMLQGLNVEQDPLNVEKPIPAIDVLFEDDHFVIINKPSGFLSAPGKTKAPSVYTWIKENFPENTDMKPVHRLDMDTSGILVIAKNDNTYISLQKQFLNKQIRKEYIAVLDGVIKDKKGIIDLPLRPDFEDRPRQMICNELGKESITEFEVIEVNNNKTRILFRPITGRTHQLRVHASHPLGLNIPIVGDSLYGAKSYRLLLHASKIEFFHPITQKRITIQSSAPF